MPLFDAYLMVDWSANTTPKTGPDSIWLALAERTAAGLRLHVLDNPATRAEALVRLGDLLDGLVQRKRRVLVGFDFPFGCSSGTSRALKQKGTPWRATWRLLSELIEDGPGNANNRFEIADTLNRWIGHRAGPFWGHPAGRSYRHLAMTRPGYDHALEEKRLCEHAITGPQTIWKLSGVGSVGGQVLTGLPVVRALRRDRRLRDHTRVWPFETGLKRLTAGALKDHPVVLAEIYPSLVRPESETGQVKDALQVQALAAHLAEEDDAGRLGAAFAGMPGLNDGERRRIENEEAWILGVTRPDTWSGKVSVDVDAAFPGGLAYINDGAAIYAESRRIIENETDLTALPAGLHPLAVRLVHTCGMPDIVHDLAASPGAMAAGRKALQAGAPVLCDVEMVAKGVIATRLPAGNKVVSRVAAPATRRHAARHHTTRSWAGIDLCGQTLEGAVVAVGNAPTALFRVLEIAAAGGPRPALVIGVPVGFVGATESKRALAASGLDFVTVHGRRGGSAMAAAAVNALMGGIA
tara:strand:+ start:131 stop:1699 length:1569 start_codon:yes stop_codon:yes gene_type:complete